MITEIRMSAGKTVNTGNFNSERFDVSVTVAVENGLVNTAVAEAEEFLREQVERKMAELRNEQY